MYIDHYRKVYTYSITTYSNTTLLSKGYLLDKHEDDERAHANDHDHHNYDYARRQFREYQTGRPDAQYSHQGQCNTVVHL